MIIVIILHHKMFHISVTLTLRFPPADWVEFSPYEIGMAKYGTFMTPDLFGSKFFMGTAIKRYEENPIHFLMGEKGVFIQSSQTSFHYLTYYSQYIFSDSGVWGSAFSILFNRVLGVKDTVGGSTMEEELGNLFVSY